MNESDKIWKEDADRNGWTMPPVAWWKRLPVIRHLRAGYYGRQAEKYRDMTRAIGLGIGGISQFDRWMIYGIARGYEPTRR